MNHASSNIIQTWKKQLANFCTLDLSIAGRVAVPYPMPGFIAPQREFTLLIKYTLLSFMIKENEANWLVLPTTVNQVNWPRGEA